MTTVKVHAEIDVNGKLRLDVPIDLPAGSAEVLIVVQPESSNGQRKASQGVRTARSGLFVGNPTDNLDVDAALNELNDGWKAKLKDVL